MKKMFLGFALFAFATSAMAETDYVAKVKELQDNKDKLVSTFGADGADKILHRLETYMGAFNSHNCSANPDDMLCGQVIGELDTYIHIAENGDTAALEKAH